MHAECEWSHSSGSDLVRNHRPRFSYTQPVNPFGPMLFAILTAATVAGATQGRIVENLTSLRDAQQSYSLYLPASLEPGMNAPALIVLDPRGRATTAAEIFRDAAEELGWVILSSNQSRSDAEVNPNGAVLQALIPEALNRYAADPNRIYIAGFSGTAISACAFASDNDRIAGVIAVGGRLVEEVPPDSFRFAHYGFAGDTDFNNLDMREIESILEKPGTTQHRFHQFEGGHTWITPELARDALEWFEVVAMRREQRPRDEGFLTRALRRDLATAAALENGGRKLEALRRFQGIVRTYEGLAPLTSAIEGIARLSADEAVARQRDEETRWDSFERSWTLEFGKRIGQAYARMREAPHLASSEWLAGQFRIPELMRRARRGGAEGRAATRLLEGAFVQTAFYLPEQLFARGAYTLVPATLGVALKIHPDRWPVHYQLAAAYGRQRDARRSVGALTRAFELGFTDRERLATDDDFAPIRDDPRFRRLLASP